MRIGSLKVCALFLGMGLVTPAFGAWGIEVALTYERYPEDWREFRPYGYQGLETATDCPEGDWRIPELKGACPLYGFAELGGEKRLVVVDRREPEANFYDRVYFDENGNADLTDDAIVDGTVHTGSSNYFNVEFPPVNTSVLVDGTIVPYSFRFSAYFYAGEEKEATPEDMAKNTRVSLRLNCCYSGEFELDGQTYRVQLGDADADGRFDEIGALPEGDMPKGAIWPQGDFVFLTPEQKFEYYDGQVLGDRWFLKGKLFDAAVSISDGRLTLTPVTQNLARLVLPAAVHRMSLYTQDRKHSVLVYDASAEILLPPDTYGLFNYQLHRQDDQGDLWRLWGSATGDTPLAELEESRGGQLVFGEPYIPRVDLTLLGRFDPEKMAFPADLPLAFTVEGRGKELLSDLSRIWGNNTRIPMSTRNPQRPKEPTYKIVKTDGEVVTSGAFEYG